MPSFLIAPPRSALLIWATALTLLTPAFAQAQVPSYRLDIIDKLPGDVVASGLKVNEAGQVLASGTRLVNNVQQAVFSVWSNPGQSYVPSLSGFSPGYITDNGNLVGGYFPGVISLAPNGTITQLSSGQRNDYRSVAAVAPNGDYAGTDDFSSQSIYLNRGGADSRTGLAFSQKPRTWAGMNNRGDIAGTTDNGDGLTINQAWIIRNGAAAVKLTSTASGFTGGIFLLDLDSRGRVLGQITNGTGNRFAIWDTNNLPTLLSAPDGFYTEGFKFNASSTVLANFRSLTGLQSAYFGINTPSGNYSWAQIANVTGTWRVLGLQDISDSGYIVGTAEANGQVVAFRMTPLSAVPEPSTLLSMALGGVGLLYLKRRRLKTQADRAV